MCQRPNPTPHRIPAMGLDPSSKPRPATNRAFRCVWLLVLVVMLIAPAATAQVNIHADIADLLYEDVAPDGTSCGDTINFIVTLGGDTNRGDLEDAVLEIPVPAGTHLTNFINAANPNDNEVIVSGDDPADRVIHVDYGTICTTQSTCGALGATLQFFLEIDDPNPFSSFSLQGTLSGSNFSTILTDHLGDAEPESPVVRTFDPCPALPEPDPARLDATLRDRLVGDLDGDGLVDAGDTVRYEAEISNIGDQSATAVPFRVGLPDHTALVDGSLVVPTGTTVRFGDDSTDTLVLIDLPRLVGHGSHALQFDVVVVTAVPAGVTTLETQGIASVSGFPATTPTDDPDTAAVDDPTVTPLDFDPDLSVAKQPTPATVAAGDLVVWNLDVTNLGRTGSGPVTLTETVPDHTSFRTADSTTGWSCSDGDGAGTACTLSLPPLGARLTTSAEFAVRVDATLPAGAESTTNTATVTDDGSQGPDPVPGNNTATATAALEAAPALRVTKTGPASARPGDTIAYQITYTNSGTQEATGVELDETVPQHTTFVAAASNPGWSCADGAPAGTPCTLSRASVAAGASATVAFAVRLADTVPSDLTVIANRVVLHRDPSDDPPEDDDPDDEIETPVDAAVDLAITKTGPPSAGAAATVVYELALTNTGDRDASGVTILETVPAPALFDAAASTAGWDCADGALAGTPCTLLVGDLPAGGTADVTFAVRLPPTIPAGLEALTNLATVTSDTPDTDPSDNDARATTPILAAPDLAVTKTDHDVVVQPAGVLLYTLTVANLGDQDAANVTVADTLPAHTTFEARASTDGWSCDTASPPTCIFTLPSLAAGAPPLELSLAVRVGPDLSPDITELVNAAAVRDDGTGGDDPDPENNSTTETTPVVRDSGPPPDRGVLAATLTDHFLLDADGDELADAEDILTYIALVESRGPADVRGVTLTLTLDPSTALVAGSVTTTQGEIVGTRGDRLEISLGDLPADTTVTVTFEADVGGIPPGSDHLSAQGTLGADNAAGTVTDDPDTPAPLDPTLTPVGDDTGPPPPHIEDIPTLGAWGLLLLVLGLTGFALRRLRPVKRGTP